MTNKLISDVPLFDLKCSTKWIKIVTFSHKGSRSIPKCLLVHRKLVNKTPIDSKTVTSIWFSARNPLILVSLQKWQIREFGKMPYLTHFGGEWAVPYLESWLYLGNHQSDVYSNLFQLIRWARLVTEMVITLWRPFVLWLVWFGRLVPFQQYENSSSDRHPTGLSSRSLTNCKNYKITAFKCLRVQNTLSKNTVLCTWNIICLSSQLAVNFGPVLDADL